MEESKKKKHKSDKSDKSNKLHVEIAAGNWRRLTAYIEAYNDSPDRLTPKYKLADVVNASLLKFLNERNK